jgi:hypothetical protein
MDPQEAQYAAQVAQQQRRNYYAQQSDTASGLKFRIDGKDVNKDIIDRLRGGLIKVANGTLVYNESMRMLSEEGISRAEFFLSCASNKNTHLTKYQNELRISTQIKPLAKAWVTEVVRNRKKWGVKDPELVVRMVENHMYSSMMRGDGGFEAELTGKNMTMSEIRSINNDQQQMGFFSKLFGRKNQGG